METRKRFLRVEKCLNKKMAYFYMAAFFYGAADERLTGVLINGRSLMKGFVTDGGCKIREGVVLMSARTRKELGVHVGQLVEVVMRYDMNLTFNNDEISS
jgi:hypothetical protein